LPRRMFSLAGGRFDPVGPVVGSGGAFLFLGLPVAANRGRAGHPWRAGERDWRRGWSSALTQPQLFECELGNLSRVFNSQPANRNDLLGDKLRDGVIAIL
jgi:hypothetical protein